MDALNHAVVITIADDMDKDHRSKSKKTKKNKKSKKRRRNEHLDDFEFSDEEALLEQAGRNAVSLVEYSDVSSEDFSGPEAGEIETDPEEATGLSPISPDESKDTSPVVVAHQRRFDKKRLGPSHAEEPQRTQTHSPNTEPPSNRVDRRQSHTSSSRTHHDSGSGSYAAQGNSNSSSNRPAPATEPILSNDGLEEENDEDDAISTSSIALHKYKKKKKKEHKRHKKGKKRKKRRTKSVSSAETISEEEDSILAGDAATPPLERNFTPPREPSLAPVSPATPPPRPASPPYVSPSVSSKRREYAPSPHTPPMPKASTHRHYEADSYHDSGRYRKHHTPGTCLNSY